MIGGIQTLAGYKVFVTPDLPKMQLSARVCEVLAPDFIAETNAWLLRFFGTWNALEDGQTRVLNLSLQVFMNPRTYAAFRNVCSARDSNVDDAILRGAGWLR